MEPIETSLRMFGAPQAAEPLPWSWVSDQLASAGTYWVVSTAHPDPELDQWPHPRPVWGVWADCCLHLSIGSPTIRRQMGQHPDVTVHLESGTDVVIVEGLAVSDDRDETLRLKELYDAKYDWDYQVDPYGMFTLVQPDVIMAWRAAGPAGRDGFSHVGRWTFTWPNTPPPKRR